MSKPKIEQSRGDLFVKFDLIEHWTEYFEGRILTIIDASFTNPQANKATKDLIKHEVSKLLEKLWDDRINMSASSTLSHSKITGDLSVTHGRPQDSITPTN